MLGRLLSLSGLSESRCSICGIEFLDEDQDYICPDCLGDIRPFRPFEHTRLEWISSYRVFGRYEGALAEVIKLVKFKSAKPLAKALGEIVKEHMEEYIKETQPDMISWVPLHPFRLWNRGFDHNREILKGVGVGAEDILIRVRYSRPLASLGRKERAKRVRGAFRIKKEFIDVIGGKRILVFDDVLTTGATASSVAEELLSLGAEEIIFYFLAREE